MALTVEGDSTMKDVRPLWLAGCAALLLVLVVCGIASASATNRSVRGDRVAYTSRELVLDGGHLRPVTPGTDITAGAASAAPATTPATPLAGAAARRGLGFAAAVTSLATQGEIDSATASADVSAWQAASAAARHLAGSRKAELGAVIGTLQTIARSGSLTPGRLPALVMTLQRNEQWWTTAPPIAPDQRVGFPGSNLVWEFYPGQGIEIQWLGTFGAANGLYDQHDTTDLAALLAQALSLAVPRAGGIAWEYDFAFDGGSPPWVSSITQGTAIEALTSAASLLHDSAYLTDAHDALGVFEAPPPLGVAAPDGAGDWYLIYSFAPHYYVINAFVQALIGLYDLAYQGDGAAAQAFQRGNAEARQAMPAYNTGYWSLYDQSVESDLSYHELLTGFLHTLCQQTSETTQQALWVMGLTPPSGSTGPSGPTGMSGNSGASGSGGTLAGGSTGASGSTGTTGTTGSSGSTGPVANPDSIYCTTATAFTADLKQPPQITIPTLPVERARRRFDIHFTLSKISNVTFAVSYDGTATTIDTALVPHGTHYFVWRAPHPGAWTIELTGVDLAGNRSEQTAPVTVTAPS